MEPITHFLTGACIGRAGFNRKSAYATVVATLAAEAADLDMFWFLKGPVTELKHHRGITHTFLGAPLVAAAIVGCVGLWHLWRSRRRVRADAAGPQLRWGWLFAAALTAALSHILLDWTNNYGVRPFFPFNAKWYAGSFMFIAEPLLWGILILALVVPWLFGLADREMGARRTPFRGQYFAIFALAGMVVLWCWRWAEHGQAMVLVRDHPVTNARVLRIAAEPYPANPWRWHVIVETPEFFQTAEVNTSDETIQSEPAEDIVYKPAVTKAVVQAKQTYLGKVYLDWGQWVMIRDLGPAPAPGAETPQLPPGRTWNTVEFSDLRYAYAYRRGGSKEPSAGLSGWVYILPNGEDAGEFMGGREEK